MILIIINNNDSFSARPEEFISLYDEYILDDEMVAVTQRISTIVDHLKKFQGPAKVEPIKQNNEFYYLENQKHSSRSFANYFLDIEVIFKIFFFIDMMNKIVFR